jgi:hypothetical protein
MTARMFFTAELVHYKSRLLMRNATAKKMGVLYGTKWGLEPN